MMPLICILAGFVGAAIGLVAGRRIGTEKERARCAGLAQQSWSNRNERKLSPTARRIWRSIMDGDAVLISEDEFFADKDVST